MNTQMPKITYRSEDPAHQEQRIKNAKFLLELAREMKAQKARMEAEWHLRAGCATQA